MFVGHFLLTMLLREDLSRCQPARVVNVSALAYQLSDSLDFDLFTPGHSNSMIRRQSDATGSDATGGDATGGDATGGDATGSDAVGGDAGDVTSAEGASDKENEEDAPASLVSGLAESF